MDAFGTHYPHAVTYGAMAKSSMSFKARDLAEWSPESKSVSAEVTIPVKAIEVTPSSGWSEEKCQSIKKSSHSVRVESFQSVGGTGSWGKEGFMSNDQRVVPVLMDLRPIYELLNPVYFDEEEILFRVRTGLEKAWNARLAGYKPDTTDSTPDLYKLTIDGLSCVNDGGEAGSTEEYYGKISYQFPNGASHSTGDIINLTDDETVDANCDTKAPAAGTHKELVFYVEPQLRASAMFGIWGELHEEESAIEGDHHFAKVSKSLKSINSLADGKTHYVEFNNDGQKARVGYRIDKLKIE